MIIENSWKWKPVSVSTDIVTNVAVNDTSRRASNIIRIRNNNSVTLYLSTKTAAVDSTNFEISVPPMSSRKFVSVLPFVAVSIYSTGDAEIIVEYGQLDKVTASDLDETLVTSAGATPHVIVDNASPVAISGEVEVKNDAGNPLPVKIATPFQVGGVLITLVAATPYTVKASPGTVFKIATVLADVQLLDAATAAWIAGRNVDFNFGLHCSTSIVLNSETGGAVWIAYA